MPAPTLADARRAADRLVEGHGAGQVLLFGSLARGEAREGSDIDLVAVFDDLGDYGARRDLWLEMSSAAEAEAGCPVDLRVTDRPEWRRRCETVTNSFERHISSDVVTLVDLPAGDVDWDKEIGMPSDEPSEVAVILTGLGKKIVDVHARFLPDGYEQEVADLYAQASSSDPQAWADDLSTLRRGRYQTLCGHAVMSLELGVKALVMMGGRHPRKSHNPDRLKQLMTQARWETVESIPEDVRRDMKTWREASDYEDVLVDLQITEEKLCDLAERFIDAAVSFTAHVISEYERTYPEYPDPGGVIEGLARRVQALQVTRSRWNLRDGCAISPTPTAGTPPPSADHEPR